MMKMLSTLITVTRSSTLNILNVVNLYACKNSFGVTLSIQFKSYTNHKRDIKKFKEKIISSLNFKCSEDAVPFYKLPTNTLIHLSKITQNDEKNGFCDNRLYYIASKIKCPPAAVSEKLVKRIFIYQLSFDWLEKSLNVLIDKGVPGDRILRDLWVLKYHHDTINERLQKIKNRGIDNLHPWMVRCATHILERYITLTHETKNILGENNSSQMYLAQRLNTSKEVVEGMYLKMPAIRYIRVTKIKAFLDFLMNEGFDVEEIIERPRILASSQKTIETRLEKLKKLDVKNINLNILCRSTKDFQKYIEYVEALKNREDISGN